MATPFAWPTQQIQKHFEYSFLSLYLLCKTRGNAYQLSFVMQSNGPTANNLERIHIEALHMSSAPREHCAPKRSWLLAPILSKR